jgi:hypothetical protein
MIVRSTPSTISWKTEDGDVIKFHGEWTLEPVFYLSTEYELMPTKSGAKTPERAQIAKERKKMIEAANARGWILREASHG